MPAFLWPYRVDNDWSVRNLRYVCYPSRYVGYLCCNSWESPVFIFLRQYYKPEGPFFPINRRLDGIFEWEGLSQTVRRSFWPRMAQDKAWIACFQEFGNPRIGQSSNEHCISENGRMSSSNEKDMVLSEATSLFFKTKKLSFMDYYNSSKTNEKMVEQNMPSLANIFFAFLMTQICGKCSLQSQKVFYKKVLQSFAIPQQSFFYARSKSDPKSSHLMFVSTQNAVFFRRVVHHLPKILNILSCASTILLFSYRALLKILSEQLLCDLQSYQMN